jgi:beta-lactamase regulating signal transducer with metallopeptidase domain
MRLEGWFGFGDSAFALLAGMMLASSTAIVLAGLLGLALRRRASARHAAWLCSLAVVLLSPGLSWLGSAVPLPPIAWPRRAPAVERPDPSPAATRPVEAPHAGDPGRSPVAADRVPNDGPWTPIMAEGVAFYGTAAPVAPVVAAGARDWPAIARRAAVAVWLLGALGLLGRLAKGFRGVARLRRTARPFRLGAVLPRVSSALSVGVLRLPAIAVSDRTDQPVTLGLLRPIVLIPDGLAEGLGADALRDVLIHECAHALRRDSVVGLLQRVAAILCWPNPLVHWMNRELESAREELCDNHVLRASDPADYATSLLAVAERLSLGDGFDALLGLPMIARRGSLEARIADLIDPRRQTATSTRRGTVAVLAVLFLAAGFAVAAVRFSDEPPRTSSKPLDPTKTRIEGVVVYESGKPAADVLVRTWEPLREPLTARTDPDGRFVLEVDAASSIGLLASNADRSLQATARNFDVLTSSRRRYEVQMTLRPSRPTTVKVVDARGAPVPDAAVEIHDDYTPWWSGRTDAGGEARFRIPDKARITAVVALKSGKGLDYFDDDLRGRGLVIEPLPETIELVLNGSKTVKVRAVDTSGQPMSGIPFIPWYLKKSSRLFDVHLGGSRIAQVATDQGGVAVFDFLPEDLAEAVPFLMASKTLHMVERIAYAPHRPESSTLTARLARATPVSGRVYSVDGKPAPGILVRAEGRGNTPDYCRTTARTGADGSFRLDLAPDQSYLIGVIDDQWAAWSRGGIIPREGLVIQHVDLHLVPGTIIKGRVTTGPDRKSVAGETVSISERGTNVEGIGSKKPASRQMPWRGEDRVETLYRWTKTDRDGRYEFRVGPGRYSLPDKKSPFDEPIEIRAEPEVVYDYEVEVEADTKPLPLVTVRRGDAEGPVVPNAYVFAAVENAQGFWEPLFKAKAGAQGQVGRILSQRSGPIYLYARSADGSFGGFATIGPDVGEGSIILEKATTVEGRAVLPDGRPAAHARLTCYVAGPTNTKGEPRPPFPPDRVKVVERDMIALEIDCDVQGRYSVPGLPVGTRVYLQHVSASEQNSAGSTNFVVESFKPIDARDIVAVPFDE